MNTEPMHTNPSFQESNFEPGTVSNMNLRESSPITAETESNLAAAKLTSPKGKQHVSDTERGYRGESTVLSLEQARIYQNMTSNYIGILVKFET